MILPGVYVKVAKLPANWDGSCEIPEEREALVGHIGVVLERDADFAFVRFPNLEDDPTFIYECNFKLSCLEIISTPAKPLPKFDF